MSTTPDTTPDPATPTGTPAQPVVGIDPTELAALQGRVEDLENAPAAPATAGLPPAKFAVFDDKFNRYVEGIHEKRPTKAEAKAAVGHDQWSIREVY